MQGNHLLLPFHVHGTLAADAVFRWRAPFPCSLRQIAIHASNDSDATVIVGTSGDTDGFLTAQDAGDSGVPSVYDLDDFDGDLVTKPGSSFPRLAAGDVLVITVDHDGAAGTAAANLGVNVLLAEG